MLVFVPWNKGVLNPKRVCTDVEKPIFHQSDTSDRCGSFLGPNPAFAGRGDRRTRK
jgi:hypothetical protein